VKNPDTTVAFRPTLTSDQRFATISLWLSLAEMWETLGEPERAGYWREMAERAGWRSGFDLTKEDA